MMETPAIPAEPEPRIIKGCPGGPEGKWEEVQAIQHEPFIYIHYNGSHWAGMEPDDVTVLLEMLAKYKLRADLGPEYASLNPCRGIENPDWTWGSDKSVPHFIDGPRLYAADGVWRFSGNFENISHAFCVETNHGPTIARLLDAVNKNAEVVEAHP